MIDLSTLLVSTRQYLLNEMDGFPAAIKDTQDKPALITACQKFVETGSTDILKSVDELGFLDVYLDDAVKQNNTLTPYFSRWCLLKFLYEETLKDSALIEDKTWFRKMNTVLHGEFATLKNGLPPIKINGREIQTLADIEEVRNQIRTETRARNTLRPYLYGAGLVYFITKATGSRNLMLVLAVMIILMSIYYLRLQNTMFSAPGVMHQANHAERQLRQAGNSNVAEHNAAILSNKAIKKFFLLDNDELAKVENPVPRPH